MKLILKDWNLVRVLRLVFGVAIMLHGIVTKDIVTAILGLLFGAFAVFNIGCCGMNSCSINTKPGKEIKNLNFEDLDRKK